jgi:ectoine hydroxylase-related dioxygenase (phytanoyl-CoA dioxygenase family)
MKISESQFATFEERGFLRLPQLCSAEKIQALIERVHALMSGEVRYEGMFFQLESDQDTTEFHGSSKDYRKIKDLEFDPLFLEFLQNEIFAQLAERYIGPNVSCMRAMVMNKPANSQSTLPWHQDISEDWAMTRPATFTIWTALEPSTKENGCLRVVVGSHHQGQIGNGHMLNDAELATHVEKGEIEYLELASGESVVFNNALLHGSGPNASQRSRLALTLCLLDADTRHTRTGKLYPILFGKDSLTQEAIQGLKKIPEHVYD